MAGCFGGVFLTVRISDCLCKTRKEQLELKMKNEIWNINIAHEPHYNYGRMSSLIELGLKTMCSWFDGIPSLS